MATWNRAINDRMLTAALSRCEQIGVSDVTVVEVPGALELPLACAGLIDSGCDAVVAIGTVVQGETDHYEIVVRESAAGIMRVALDKGIPVGNAILAVREFEQALERSEPDDSNKGVEAVDAAVAMTTVLTDLRKP